MATKRRIRSESGFYHVFQRGVNHFDMFEDDNDREFFLEKLKMYASNLGIGIYAWCLMSNHIHLLVRADFSSLSILMRQLGSVYARRFNYRHGRSGPLFEGRFGSVCVETNEQFMATLRYIHRNPAIHEETSLCGSYRWSSFGEYVNGSPVMCDLSFAFSLFGDLGSFVAFHEERNDGERHIDVGTCGRMSDDEARVRANLALASEGFEASVADIGSLPCRKRDAAIQCVRQAVGCSLRQIQRLTAIAYSAIRKAIELVAGKSPEESSFGAGPSRGSELAVPMAALPMRAVRVSIGENSGLLPALTSTSMRC